MLIGFSLLIGLLTLSESYMTRMALFVILLLLAMSHQAWAQVGIPDPILTQFKESEVIQRNTGTFRAKAFRFRAFNVQAPESALQDVHNAAYELDQLAKSGRKIQFSTLSGITHQLTKQLKPTQENSLGAGWLRIDLQRGKLGMICHQESERHQFTTRQSLPRPNVINGQPQIWCETLRDFHLGITLDPKMVLAVKERQDQAANPIWVVTYKGGIDVSFSSPSGCFQHYLSAANGRPVLDRLQLGEKLTKTGIYYHRVVAETRFNQQGISQVGLYVIEELELGDFVKASDVPVDLELKTRLPKIRSPE